MIDNDGMLSAMNNVPTARDDAPVDVVSISFCESTDYSEMDDSLKQSLAGS